MFIQIRKVDFLATATSKLKIRDISTAKTQKLNLDDALP
jgi:hypothetical protein